MTLVASLIAVGCARYSQINEAGDVIDPAEAAKTVVLHVNNQNVQTVEIRTIINNQARFVGTVASRDSADILLDARSFPSGFFYVTATPTDGRGRAVAGPLSASKGDKVRFFVEPTLSMSRAIVVR